jgi:hypothetical protein
MMKKVEETYNRQIKKEWVPPSFQIIPFKHTSGGGPDNPPEDSSYNPAAS